MGAEIFPVQWVLDYLIQFRNDNLHACRMLSSNNELEKKIDRLSHKIKEIEKQLKEMHCEKVCFNSDMPLMTFGQLWKSRLNRCAEAPSKSLKERFIGELMSISEMFVDSVNVFPFVDQSEPSATIRGKSVKEEQNRLEKLNKRRFELKRQIEEVTANLPQDTEEIEHLKALLVRLQMELSQTKKTLDNIKSDSEQEEQMRNRIEEAFEGLSKDNHLENELKKLNWEFHVMLCSIPVIIIFFLLLYTCFLCHLRELKLYNWCDYLPYTMAVPIFVGLLWFCAYHKNRAGKISIELSSRLYNIRYLEGLMKMTSSMSRTSTEASERIAEITHSLVDSFLNKMQEKSFKEKELSIIEKEELKDNPYWKMVRELKNLIKVVKQ